MYGHNLLEFCKHICTILFYSNSKKIKLGVFHGSVLDLVLFLVFIDDTTNLIIDGEVCWQQNHHTKPLRDSISPSCYCY